ncbi:S-layer homology domain-containing protein [Patescibacteria group bacterium]|nr:S-layer homology domain-containing protein [Patescibacteria group bacterium]
MESADIALDNDNNAVIALSKAGIDDIFIYYDSDRDNSFATKLSKDHSAISGAGVDFEKIRIAKHPTNNSLAVVGSRLGATDGDFFVSQFTAGASGASMLTGEEDQYSATNTRWLGQTFTPSISGTADQIDLKLWRQTYHTDGNVNVELYATSSGTPTGSALCSGSIVLNTVTVGAPGNLEEITMAGCPSLTAGTKYAVVLSMSDTDWVFWMRDKSSPIYTGGTRITSINSGSTWSTSSAEDFIFEVHIDRFNTLAGDDTLCNTNHCSGASLAYEQADNDLIVLFNDKDSDYKTLQGLYNGSAWSTSEVYDFTSYSGFGNGNTELQITSDGTYKAVMTHKPNEISSPFVVAYYGEKASGGSWSFGSVWPDIIGQFALDSDMRNDKIWIAGNITNQDIYSTTDYVPNVAPSISSISAIQQSDDGYVDIDYILTDADDESDISLASYEYTLDGAEWNVMEPVADDVDHDGVSDLTGAPGGTAHTFVWVPCNDWDTYEDDVLIRLTPDDGDVAGNTTTIASSIVFDCATPVVSNVAATQTAETDTVVFSYDLADDTTTGLTVALDISEDRGSTWEVADTSLTGAVGEGQSTGLNKTISWDAGSDFADQEQSDLRVRIRATDNFQNAGPNTSSLNFPLDTAGPSGLANFAWASDTSNSATLTWDSGVGDANFNHYELWWGTVQNDVENRQGTANEWDDSPNDAALASISTTTTTIDGLSEGQTYYVKIWAIDDYLNESSVAAVTESSNYTPIVSNISGTQQTEDGYVNIDYTALDNNSDNVSATLYQYSTNGTTWNTMAEATDDAAHDGISALTATPEGSAHVFVWDACSDLGDAYEDTIYFKLQINDGNENSEAVDTTGGAGIEVDCALPIVSEINAAQTLGTDAVVVTYDSSDDNTTNLLIELDISEDSGNTWTVTDASVSGDIGANQTTGSSKTISWDAETDFTNQEQTDLQIRIRAKDKFQNQGVNNTSVDFEIDTKAPVGLTELTSSESSTSSIAVTWPSVSDSNFSYYKIWYGDNASDVSNRTLSGYTTLSDINTTSTTITGLMQNLTYYFGIWAVDLYGHESTAPSIMSANTKAAGGAYPFIYRKKGGTTNTSDSIKPTPIVTDETVSIVKKIAEDSVIRAEEEILIPKETQIIQGPLATSESEAIILKPVEIINKEKTISLFISKETELASVGKRTFVGIIDPPIIEAPNALDLSKAPGGNILAAIKVKTSTGESVYFSKPAVVAISLASVLEKETSFDPNNLAAYVYSEETGNYEYIGYLVVSKNKTAAAFSTYSLKTFVVFDLDKADIGVPKFVDIRGHWAKPYIEELHNANIVSGQTNSTFAPQKLITRGEFAKIALLAFNYDIPPSTDSNAKSGFYDLPTDHWAFRYICAAKANNLMVGYDDGTIRMDQPIGCAEALKILILAAGIKDRDLENMTQTPLKDVEEGSWYAPFINFAVNKNIDSCYQDGLFDQNFTLTRGEAARMIVETMNSLN